MSTIQFTPQDYSSRKPNEPSLRDPVPSAAASAVNPAGAIPQSREQPAVLAPKGEIEFFGNVSQQYRSMCMKRALRTMRNRVEAEDAVQNGLWKAFQHRQQFQGNGAFAGWLSRIVQNECLMRLREDRKLHLVYLDDPIEPNVRLELISPAPNVEDRLGQKEVAEILRKEILRMPRPFRQIVLLHDSQQLSMPQVAERLGLTVTAAKSRLARARKELRCRMQKHCGRKGPGTLFGESAGNSTAYTRAN